MMFGPDVESVAVMPAMLPAGTSGWFGRATPGNDDATPVGVDFLNTLKGELERPLLDAGVTLVKTDLTQLATLLSGVHGIVSNVRSTLTTVAVSTTAKRAAAACEDALVSGYTAFAGGGVRNTDSGLASGSLGGINNVNSGQEAVSLGCESCINSGDDSASIGCLVARNSALAATSIGVFEVYNSGEHTAVTGGRYYENIDDHCLAMGYGVAAPANFGDGLTNKNITVKLHADTGNAEFTGDVTVEGKLKNTGGADVVFDDSIDVEGDAQVRGKLKNAAGADVVVDDGLTVEEKLTVSGDTALAQDVGLKAIDLGDLTVDWDTGGTDIEKAASGVLVTYDEAHAVEFFDLTINNTSGGDVDMNIGETIFCNIAGHVGATPINMWCETTAATGTTANALKSLRFTAARCGDGSGNTRIAVTSAGAKGIPIPASNAGSVTVRVYIQVAVLTV